MCAPPPRHENVVLGTRSARAHLKSGEIRRCKKRKQIQEKKFRTGTSHQVVFDALKRRPTGNPRPREVVFSTLLLSLSLNYSLTGDTRPRNDGGTIDPAFRFIGHLKRALISDRKNCISATAGASKKLSSPHDKFSKTDYDRLGSFRFCQRCYVGTDIFPRLVSPPNRSVRHDSLFKQIATEVMLLLMQRAAALRRRQHASQQRKGRSCLKICRANKSHIWSAKKQPEMCERRRKTVLGSLHVELHSVGGKKSALG